MESATVPTTSCVTGARTHRSRPAIWLTACSSKIAELLMLSLSASFSRAAITEATMAALAWRRVRESCSPKPLKASTSMMEPMMTPPYRRSEVVVRCFSVCS